ncbi:protein kinase family protein [Rickettsiella massiliensis]|uniref:phosphotransferase n=1 Tax=Rickettsiella massiliensis TaxID=676517 RepID=UPI00029A504A|nr:phosphotransferase [Rickettsiella massiliensis]
MNETYFFRFPSREVAVALLAQENQCLRLLQTRLSCAIPNPLYQGQPCADFPYPFQGYVRLVGSTDETLTQV